jgi:anti-sigma regulatory factor (Ser/Thr protein kinase)
MDTIDGTVVPPCRAQVCWVVDAGLLDVSVARNAAYATMHNWGMGVLADDVALIVGELAANAWEYRQPPIAVMLRLEDSSILVEVSDAEPSIIVFSKPEQLRVHGRGFNIVASLAHELGLYADHAGKTVWARLYFHWATPSDKAAA